MSTVTSYVVPDGTVSVPPTRAAAFPARVARSGGGVLPSAMITTRPSRIPSRIAAVESSGAQTRTLAASMGKGPRCQSLEPIPVIRRP